MGHGSGHELPMKVSLEIRRGNSSVWIEVGTQDLDGIAAKLEDQKDHLNALLDFGRGIGAANTNTSSSPTVDESQFTLISDKVDQLRAKSQVEQAITILYAVFKNNANDSLTAGELAEAFARLGLVKPSNPSDIMLKASKRGSVRSENVDGKARYRLTVGGVKDAEGILTDGKA